MAMTLYYSAEEKMTKHDRIAGGLYGLLIGDALGVPYEFYPAEELPCYEEIEMVPPAGFRRSHSTVKPGTWSDDGAQALCLLDILQKQKKFSLKDFSDALSSWYENGLWAVDGVVFDVGIQTANGLRAYKKGLPPEKCGLLNPDGKGNGALMRVLPLVLWHNGFEEEGSGERGRSRIWKGSREKALVLDAHEQCLVTHGHICNQVCCALYCLVAQALLDGRGIIDAIKGGVRILRGIYSDMPEYEQELEWSVRPDLPWEGGGSGYVVDCLRSAFMVLEQTSSYEEAVKRAVLLGNDTDTTACVTGGLAGIYYGLQGIPKRWLSMLRGQEKVETLLAEIL